MKKWVKVLLCAVLAVVLLVGSYVAYVFIDYHRQLHSLRRRDGRCRHKYRR